MSSAPTPRRSGRHVRSDSPADIFAPATPPPRRWGSTRFASSRHTIPPHRTLDPRASAFHRFALVALALDGRSGLAALRRRADEDRTFIYGEHAQGAARGRLARVADFLHSRQRRVCRNCHLVRVSRPCSMRRTSPSSRGRERRWRPRRTARTAGGCGRCPTGDRCLGCRVTGWARDGHFPHRDEHTGRLVERYPPATGGRSNRSRISCRARSHAISRRITLRFLCSGRRFAWQSAAQTRGLRAKA